MTKSILSSLDAPAVGILSLREGVSKNYSGGGGGAGVFSQTLGGHLRGGGARLCHSGKSDVGYTLVCASVSVKRG